MARPILRAILFTFKDPAMADYRRGFESLHREVYEPSLPTEGALPDWLTGTLI